MITLSPTNNRLYFLKAIFPYKKCILIKLYMLPSDGIFSIKTAFIFGNTFFRFFLWGKNKTKNKTKKGGGERKDRLELKILLLQDRTIYFRLKIVYHDWAFLSEKESLQIIITLSNAVVQFAFSPLAHWLAWLFRMFFRRFLAFILSMPSKGIIMVIKSMFLGINMFCAFLKVVF